MGELCYCKVCGIKINTHFLFSTGIEFEDGFYCYPHANEKRENSHTKQNTNNRGKK